jgi:hypothetical protein
MLLAGDRQFHGDQIQPITTGGARWLSGRPEPIPVPFSAALGETPSAFSGPLGTRLGHSFHN